MADKSLDDNAYHPYCPCCERELKIFLDPSLEKYSYKCSHYEGNVDSGRLGQSFLFRTEGSKDEYPDQFGCKKPSERI